MKFIGISEGFHDAAIAVVDEYNQLQFATQAERYTRVKNDRWLPDNLVQKEKGDQVIYYENTEFKRARREHYSQSRIELKRDYDIKTIFHHESHMAAGYYTAPFTDDVVCVVIDAVGEYDTATIWKDGKKIWSKQYPWSLGMFYSAITKRIGLKPNEDEYITMGMAAYGDAEIDMSEEVQSDCSHGFPLTKWFWKHPYDIAASAQYTIEQEILKIMREARKHGSKLVYGGGVALNCVANSKIRPMFDDMWIFPNPGDAGSALGCILAHTKKRLDYPHTFWGENIFRDLEVNKIVKKLVYKRVCGVANGQAEFGPRALGNRSLLADVRTDVKDTVNDIKRRQKFRPFAPAILEEFYDEYFEGYANEYMQFVSKAKHDYTSVTHVDGTARVQVVKNDGSNLREILEYYYEVTKVPMLLNTSLNIKGQPIVNTWEDAKQFETKYGVDVL